MEEIKIGFTGDFCPWLRVSDRYQAGNWKSVFQDVHPFFQENDLNVIDLECPLTSGSDKIIKTGPHINSPVNTAEILQHLNCNLVATANNHFKDYGWQGMQDTYKALVEHKIKWFGSGANLSEASETTYFEIKGFKIALINMTESEWSIADTNIPGCNPIDYPNSLLKIQEARDSKSNAIIVILHGGHEHYSLPSPRMKAQFRFMIDAGADAVVGHHTHIISGYEEYRGKPIFYSLGNFCFDWPGLRNGTWNKGMLLRLTIAESGAIGYSYKFILQNDEKVGVTFLQDSEELEQEIQRLNKVIADDLELEQQFKTYCDKQSSIMLSRIQPYRNRILSGLHKRGLIPSIMGKSKQNMIQILSRCESHREVLLHTLAKNNS